MSDQIQIDENMTWVVADTEQDDIAFVTGKVRHVERTPCVGTCSPGRNEITMNADAAVRHLGGGESASSAGSQTGGGFVPWPLIVIPAVILLASIAGAGLW